MEKPPHGNLLYYQHCDDDDQSCKDKAAGYLDRIVRDREQVVTNEINTENSGYSLQHYRWICYSKLDMNVPFSCDEQFAEFRP